MSAFPVGWTLLPCAHDPTILGKGQHRSLLFKKILNMMKPVSSWNSKRQLVGRKRSSAMPCSLCEINVCILWETRVVYSYSVAFGHRFIITPFVWNEKNFQKWRVKKQKNYTLKQNTAKKLLSTLKNGKRKQMVYFRLFS